MERCRLSSIAIAPGGHRASAAALVMLPKTWHKQTPKLHILQYMSKTIGTLQKQAFKKITTPKSIGTIFKLFRWAETDAP